MTYQTFEEEVISRVTNILPDDYKVHIKPVSKNNGIVLHGLIINNGHSNISPTIYLDYYYDEYKDGSTIEELTEEIMTQYERFALEADFDISVFTDFEKCKPNISYKLINFEKNKKLLNDVPHIIYLDLAIVFYCLLNSEQLETSSILIRNSHMKLWDISVNDLFDIASANTPKLLKYELRNLTDIVGDMVKMCRDNDTCKEAELCYEDLQLEQSPMYILTNKLKLYGACCILYKNLLEEFANKVGSDIYIIPSSVHEVLLVPESDAYNGEYLTELVQEVNTTQLSPDEVLSDHVYRYCRAEDAITY